MYKDVNVMDINSESDSEPKKKKDPTADIHEFWTKAPHIKGDKKGQCICKLCQSVNLHFCTGIYCKFLFSDNRTIANECTTLWRHSAAFHKVHTASNSKSLHHSFYFNRGNIFVGAKQTVLIYASG